ncbi:MULTISPECIES: sugar ABC transporter substrate-binding protein [unclassified Paenibacillus]|uniref:sugar ABC transporter substrate-binding protein n=1 Tax=unclassified Paenibacillus TaxID=185978 RepID=UPI002404A555|nr:MULTISPECIES: sugar ABC transporter substrate-binding protein [unclassified Paenibacillus]MDF9839346.1 inositol transport system substrate-binding protein [Paenibacillus sp. PastF-2]MDF9845927.1 inositol transport system substrate-binding protein [Paenibacillus sp. PastM-2]MDF9852500.1 inositol transport system substrate-binding protein [Paenibacillus sp. PastF-1]MDH6477770.1 inositol transport system substrate-binding protein [Paenibacillus sp. PastH-2]MDH6505509.1 inositol transport syste
MKKTIVTLVSMLLVTGMLAGCGNSDKANSANGGEKANGGDKVYKIAYIARAQSDSFAAWLANAVKEEAKKYPDIKLEVFDGQANDDKENSMIENAITNKFDLVIVQPNNGEAQRPYVEKVIKAGKFAVTTNARISGIEGASSVDADPYEQAGVNARAALDQIPQNAKVVVLNGPSGNFHADKRRESWQKEFFDKRPDVQIVGEQIANWNKDEAMKYMEDWVQANDKIDAVISMNDNMAAGAIEAVKDNSKFDGMLAYGVDGTLEAFQLIKEGKMTSTCLQNAFELAEKLLDTSSKLLTGAEKQVDTDIGNPLITKDNVDEYIALLEKAEALK